jgi:tetratricopeptide (TPR) repeat protein
MTDPVPPTEATTNIPETPEPSRGSVPARAVPAQSPLVIGLVAVALGLLVGLGIGYLLFDSSGTPSSTGESTATSQQGVDALLAEGLALQQTGQTALAQTKYNEVLVLQPDNKYALYNLGVVEQTSGNASASIDFYRRALAADPAFISARYNLALALRDLGDASGAISEFEQVLAQDPNAVSTLINLGNLLIENGDPERGEELLARGEELQNQTP